MAGTRTTDFSTADQLVALVEAQVAAGDLTPGERLPSVRTRADAAGVAPNTVAAAYRRLRERGVVTGRGRQGTVVADRPPTAAAPSAEVPPGVIDAMTGNPDSALLPNWVEALTGAATAPAARYGDALVDADLRAVAAGAFRADGIDAAHLTVVSGAMDALERVLVARCRPGDRVGVEDPGYAAVHRLVRGLGLVPTPIAIDDRGPLPQSLGPALRSGLEALIVTPRAHNPTGAALDDDRAHTLGEVLAAHPSPLLILDDHAGPVSGVPFVGLDAPGRHWVTVRSMAKSLGPDLRVAVVAGDRDTIGRVEGRLQLGPGWVSHLLQRAAATLLTEPSSRTAIDHAAEIYRARRDRLRRRLEDAGVPSTGRSGLHVWIPVADEQSVAAALLRHDVAVRTGAAYRLASPPAIRVTTAALNNVQLDRVADAIAGVLTAPGAAASSTA
ncbi:MAG: aminotransferase class I/II-fold pyridoxal phosphate-dependent enzyme [Microthrixaceae bacterium]